MQVNCRKKKVTDEEHARLGNLDGCRIIVAPRSSGLPRHVTDHSTSRCLESNNLRADVRPRTINSMYVNVCIIGNVAGGAILQSDRKGLDPSQSGQEVKDST